MPGTRMITDWTFSITVSHDRDREHTSLIQEYADVYDHVQTNWLAGQIEEQQAAFYWANGDPSDPEDNFDGFTDQYFAAKAVSLQRYDSTDITATARFDFHRLASLKFEYMGGKREVGGNNVEFKPQAVRIGLDLVF